MMLRGDRQAIRQYLEPFRERGAVNYLAVLQTDLNHRIPELAKNAGLRTDVKTAIAASLMSAFENINLRLSLSEDQIVELADLIIESSAEDNLALEDILLFLGDLLTGKAGKIYDRMDIPTFFELFETYRQKRHERIRQYRYEEEVRHRSLPINDRFIHDDQNRQKDQIRTAVKDYLIAKSNNDDSTPATAP